MEFPFKRKNHLKSKAIIDSLFLHGKALNKSSIRLVYLEVENSDFKGIQVLINVPKRRFKLAVSRNRIRRLISEAYRLNSVSLQQKIEQENKHVALAILFVGAKEPTFNVVQEVLVQALNELTKKYVK